MGTPKAGRLSKIDIETAVSGGTYTDLGGVQDATLSVNLADIDVTDKDSAGWDEAIPGQGSLQIQMTCNYEEDDSGQAKLITAIINKETRLFRFRPWGDTSGADQWVCYGFPTSEDIESPNKEALSFGVTIKLTGTPTQSDQ